MAHLNYFPPRVAGINFYFFLAVSSGGGCCYYAKCAMVLRKIDGKINIQNCGYSEKLRNGYGGNICFTADDNGSCHGLAPSFFEEMIRCRRKKYHWRWCFWWLGNPNGISKFCKYRVQHRISFNFMFNRSWLMLRGWWRLLKITQTSHSRLQKHRRWWPGNPKDRSKFCIYQNLCLRDQSIYLEKHIFCCSDAAIAHCYFFLLSLRMAFVLTYEQIVFDDLDPHRKTEIYLLKSFL